MVSELSTQTYGVGYLKVFDQDGNVQHGGYPPGSICVIACSTKLDEVAFCYSRFSEKAVFAFDDISSEIAFLQFYW